MDSGWNSAVNQMQSINRPTRESVAGDNSYFCREYLPPRARAQTLTHALVQVRVRGCRRAAPRGLLEVARPLCNNSQYVPTSVERSFFGRKEQSARDIISVETCAGNFFVLFSLSFIGNVYLHETVRK